MALILLIMIGASAGWLASILTRIESPGAILRQIGIGLVASLVAGLFMNSATFLGGLSWVALGSAVAAAIVALIAYHFLFGRDAKQV